MQKRLQYLPVGCLLLRSVTLLWLVLWMLAVPLVHVHPEADHHHGEAGHGHGGLPHTVFSADLPCEYGSIHQHEGAGRVVSPVEHAAHTGSHTELAFSLLTPSTDEWSLHYAGPIASAIHTQADSPEPRQPRTNVLTLPGPISVLLTDTLSPRAPPILVA
jgi:hypothetical protein